MRTRNESLRVQLRRALRAQRPVGTLELAARLNVTPQTVRRLLAELPPDALLTAGGPRRARHALRRPLRGLTQDLPLFSVDAKGRSLQLATLALAEPEGTLLPLEGTPWPVPEESRAGWWEGLPYPIDAMRPAGYMGRLLARAEHVNLGVAEDPDRWSDDDILWVLTRRGADVPGNLILGEPAFDAWMRVKVDEAPLLRGAGLPRGYADLAAQAIALGGGGSSAAGEFPKFAALRDVDGAATPHVLVKFSGAAGTAAERRWADLLVCEHLALERLQEIRGVRAARSRIVQHAGRTFLESERFDRVGLRGRLATCALDAIDPAFIGSRETSWPALGGRLRQLGLVDDAGLATIASLWWFGSLIANTDMHLGNLSFFVDRTLRPAPAYDMLPMLYAPLPGGEVPARSFTPALPQPAQLESWREASEAAIAFWAAAGADRRISAAFRGVCRDNEERLRRVADRI